MATGGKLEVQIGADKTDFDKKIKEIEFDIKELSKVKLDRLKVGLDTTEINAQIKDAKNSLNQLKSTIKDTGSAVGKDFTQKMGNGSNALMQFSRIAQDAPYGIIGIGNNITATVESFGYLKNATGSTGGALKALGKSIVGSGGILLGVSLLTTGLTYLAQSGLSVGDVIDKLTGKTDLYKEALKKSNDEAYNSKGVQEAVSNVNELTNEINLAKQGFLNKDQVVKHYNETIGKTTGLVNSIEEAEKSLTRNADAYIKMTLYKAAANIAAEDAAKNLLEAEKTRAKKLTEFSNAFLDADLTQTRSKEQYDQKQKDLAQKQKNRQLEEIKLNEDSAKINLAIFKKFQNDAAKIAKANNFNFFGDNSTTKTPKAKQVKDTTHASFKPAFIAPFVSSISGLGDTMAGFEERTKIAFENASATVKTETDKMTLALQTFNDNAASIISNSITNTFIGLGEAIGNALANGADVLGAVGASLLSSLGGILTDMGKMAIQVGVGLIAIRTALKSLNPAVAIGAGVALVALGGFFQAKASSIGGGIGGGGGVSSGSGASANNNTFTSSGFGAQSTGGTVVFEIAGTKLIGVLSNTINSNKRLGGQLGLG